LAYEIAYTANRRRVDEEYAVLSDNLAVRDDQKLLPTGAARWAQHGPPPETGDGMGASYPTEPLGRTTELPHAEGLSAVATPADSD
jgi:DNA adenine methylase